MAATKLNAWLKRLAEPPGGIADSLIAKGVVLVGDLRFTGVLYLDGELRGHLEGGPGAMLVLTENGLVTGDIRCPYVVVNGAVEGNVEAESHAHLQAGARISGHVYYRQLQMHTGAEVAGHLIRRDERHAPLKDQPELPLPASTPIGKDNS